MAVPASITAAAVAVVVIAARWRTAVKRCPPTVDRLATAIIANHHPLAGDASATVSAAGIGGSTTATGAVSGLSGGWRHDRKANSQSEEGKDRFHRVGMVLLFCQAALVAATLSDLSRLASIQPTVEFI